MRAKNCGEPGTPGIPQASNFEEVNRLMPFYETGRRGGGTFDFGLSRS
jgi:hypothetical protein